MREINKVRVAITYYCELYCKHCYVPSYLRENYEDIQEKELTVDQIINFIDILKTRYNLKKVDVTGGEALLSKVWPRTSKLIDYILSNGLEVQINTTGSGDITIEQIREVVGNRISFYYM